MVHPSSNVRVEVRRLLRRSPVFTASLFACMMSAHAYAQESANPEAKAPPADANGVQEVVVTGSRISGLTNLTSASPISVATQEDIVLSKSVHVEEILSRVPGVDFNGGQNQANVNGNGTSAVALRNLGPERTLVLIDGQRVIAQNGANANLNGIPLSMVDRVEVLKDGASSIYGADAIGGVINLITKKRVDGIILDTDYGVDEHGGTERYGFSGIFGAQRERGGAMVGLSWEHRDPTYQSDRAWAIDSHGTDPNYPGSTSVRVTRPTVLQNANNPTQLWVGAANSSVVSNANDSSIVNKAPGLVYVPGLNSVALLPGSKGWNYLTSGLDQKTINFNGHYDLSSNVTLLADGFHVDYKDTFRQYPALLAGTQIGTPVYPGFIIPSTNPYNVSGADITANLVPAQLDPRSYFLDSETLRARVGLEGKIAGNFKWELGYVYQETSATFGVHNQVNLWHLGQLTGQIPCQNVPSGCTNGRPTVPVNFFNGPNIFTPAEVDYLTYDNLSPSTDSQRYFYGDIGGALFDLPAGPLQAAIGFEQREENFRQNFDELTQDGWSEGGVSLPTSGGYDVTSFYGELRVPLLRDRKFAQELNLTPSVRYDDYSTFGGYTTYKAGLDFKFNPTVRFRTAFATALRAPRVAELFEGWSEGNPGASGDPCETNPAYGANGNYGKGVLTAGSTCSLAVAGGQAVTSFTSPSVDASPNAQMRVLKGGNENLQPEDADTFTTGVVLTPGFAPGLTFAADYYRIKLSNSILREGVAGAAGVDFVLLQCYGQAQNQNYCNLINRRGGGNPDILLIDSRATNVGSATARGMEYQIAYNTRAANWNLPFPGYFNFDLTATNQLERRQVNSDGTVVDYNGHFNGNNQTNQPKWRSMLTADYVQQSWKVRYDVRFSQHTSNISGGQEVPGNTVPNIYYHDLSLSFDRPDTFGAQSMRITLGVDNLLDEEPPFIATSPTCRCNSIAGPFDFVGRSFYGRVSATF